METLYWLATGLPVGRYQNSFMNEYHLFESLTIAQLKFQIPIIKQKRWL